MFMRCSKGRYSNFSYICKCILPCLEDESKILLPENDLSRLPADPLHVNVDHHQICALLIRVILHKLQVNHWLWEIIRQWF